MDDAFNFRRAYHPALRTVAPREHQQASQASVEVKGTVRAKMPYRFKPLALKSFLKLSHRAVLMCTLRLTIRIDSLIILTDRSLLNSGITCGCARGIDKLRLVFTRGD